MDGGTGVIVGTTGVDVGATEGDSEGVGDGVGVGVAIVVGTIVGVMDGMFVGVAGVMSSASPPQDAITSTVIVSSTVSVIDLSHRFVLDSFMQPLTIDYTLDALSTSRYYTAKEWDFVFDIKRKDP